MTTPLTTADIIKGLTIKSVTGNNFAASLLAGYNKYKSFTPKQLTWAEKLARESLSPETVKPAGESVGADFVKIINRFNIAKNNGLKRPALTFQFNSSPLKISLAPETGANKGFLYVKSGVDYLGKISPSGLFSKSGICGSNIIEFLKQIGNDPVNFSAQHGRETGQCCFCARELTTKESLFVGYGPCCASKWQLPWGKTN